MTSGVKLEAQLDGKWEDLSRYFQPDSFRTHATRVGENTISAMGPRTQARLVAYAVRVKARPMLVETYGPSGNPTVAACRATTALSARDRAQMASRGPGGRGPTPPSRRLATFGMRVVLDDSAQGWHLEGDTPRQRKCYLRAVDRWMRAGGGA